MEQENVNFENEQNNQTENKTRKSKKWIVLIVIALCIVAIIGIWYSNKNKISENDLYNVNNNSGNLVVKIDEFYYVMGTDFFIKIDENNNIVNNIGEENNTSNFTIEPDMQIYGDYIYYSVGGYYQEIYRYNYKENKIEKYELPEEIREASSAKDGVCSSYFIRENNLYYQPYAEDYYYAINLENQEYKKLQDLEISEQAIVLSFEPNMYKNIIYYNKSNKLSCLNVQSNKINTIIDHKCADMIIHDNKIYYGYNNGIYKADLSGKNEELIYNNNQSVSLISVNDKYLYVETTVDDSPIYLFGGSTKVVKIVDIETKNEVNEISDYKNLSITEDRMIVTNYEEKEAYIYKLDGSDKTLIYKTVIEETEENDEQVDNTENVEQQEETTEEQNEAKVKITAEVYFLSKDEGGRHTPFFMGYAPGYKIGNTEVKGKITSLNSSMVMPGDTVTMTIELYTEDNIANGSEIQVIEGGKVVGKGTIKEVYSNGGLVNNGESVNTTPENPESTNNTVVEPEQVIDPTKTSFNVVLKETGSQNVRVIQVLKNELGLSLSEAKDLTKKTPIVIKENVPRQEAIALRDKLKEVGATVELQ